MPLTSILRLEMLWRTFGLGDGFRRVRYLAEMRSGWLRHRLPISSWQDQELREHLAPHVPVEPGAYCAWRERQPVHFFFRDLEFAAGLKASAFAPRMLAIAEADNLLAGNWRLFGGRSFSLGFPPDWHRNALTSERVATDLHWTEIGDFDHGDIKPVWQASRFACAFLLARAWAVTRDERYPARFWTLVEDWAQHNPPQAGPHWKCGQETALRLMAWCFGLFAFRSVPCSTPERVARVAAMVAVHADRITRTLHYARSQKNNHALSEAAGLWTAGILFPEMKRAALWRHLARRTLEREVPRQFYPDGSYIQHSTNYHRMALQLVLWVLRLGELNGQPLSTEVRDAFARGVEWLDAMVDAATGEAPNLGWNDGSSVLPLDSCAFRDCRPVLQAAHFLLERRRCFAPGPWDEPLLWLFGREAVATSPQQPLPTALTPLQNFSDGGYCVLRGDNSRGIMRAATFRHRPSHADQLHLDLWFQGINIAQDAGTYLYNAPPPWDALAGAAVHNTVTVDGQDQMIRGGRFLWLDWSRGRVLRHQCTPQGLLCEAEHDGYARVGVRHRRSLACIAADTWIVVDDLIGAGDHSLRLHWLLADLPHAAPAPGCLRLQMPAGQLDISVYCSAPADTSVLRAEAASTRGWSSPAYAEKCPALSLVSLARGALPMRWITVFASPEVVRDQNGNKLVVHAKLASVELSLQPGVTPMLLLPNPAR